MLFLLSLDYILCLFVEYVQILFILVFLMVRPPPSPTPRGSSAASDVYKRLGVDLVEGDHPFSTCIGAKLSIHIAEAAGLCIRFQSEES